jgi:hypothetical protein
MEIGSLHNPDELMRERRGERRVGPIAKGSAAWFAGLEEIGSGIGEPIFSAGRAIA